MRAEFLFTLSKWNGFRCSLMDGNSSESPRVRLEEPLQRNIILESMDKVGDKLPFSLMMSYVQLDAMNQLALNLGYSACEDVLRWPKCR